MNRPCTKVLLLVLLLATAFTSCKKEKENNEDISADNLAGTYTLVSVKAISNVDNSIERDKTSEFVTDCQRDDQYLLNADMSFVYKEAGIKCADTGNHDTAWKLNDTHIKFDQFEGEVAKLTNRQLVVVYVFTVSGITYTETYLFNRG